MREKEYCVAREEEGLRLDTFLGRFYPDLGLRGRKRRIETGAVLLNGHKTRAGILLKCGDRVSYKREEDGCAKEELCVIQEDERYCFVAKPRFLHTVSLAGKNNASLEARLPAGLELLQRLDFETSGIVTAARKEESKLAFRRLERTGAVEKRYLCLLKGELARKERVCTAIVSDGFKGVRILQNEKYPPSVTTLEPLVHCCIGDLGELLPMREKAEKVTLAGACIAKGARHQIRAQAAYIGYPLLGDALYGGEQGASHFFLHHGCIRFAEYTVRLLPDWNIPLPFQEVLKTWLQAH